MSNLTKRLLTAGVGIPLLFLALFAYDGIAVPAVLLILVVLLLWECSGLLQLENKATKAIFTGIGGISFLCIVSLNREAFLLIFGPTFFFSLFMLLLFWFILWADWSSVMRDFRLSRSKDKSHRPPPTLSVTISSASRTARILLSIGCLVVLVGLCSTFYGLNTYVGPWFLIYVLAVAWSTDTGAYFVGRAVGKRPLAKRISPNKTLEGSIGGCFIGFVFACFGGYWLFESELGFRNFLILAFALPILAIVGDLLESMLKRISDAKESGSILPGHGGLLDRMDSLLLVAPFMMVTSTLFGVSTR